MATVMEEILLLEPMLVEKVWGGDRLLRFIRCEKTPQPDKRYGEAWLLYIRDDISSLIRSGCYEGRSLTDVVKEDPISLLGRRFANRRFPLICKFISAESSHISLQLHPDKDAVQRFREKDAPKNELWYLIETLRQPSLVIGLKEEEYRERLLEPSLLKSAINRIEACAGDVFRVRSGVLHSILAGTVLFEVSNNSDLTYRLYDWERCNRETHPQKALSSLRISRIEDVKLRGEVSYSKTVETTRYATDFCTLEQFDIMGSFNILPTGVFRFGIILWGEAEIDGLPVGSGLPFLIPAAASALEVTVKRPTRMLLVTP